MIWILIALGGGIGATLRYVVQTMILKRTFPSYLSTIIVNLVGSFLFGLSCHWLVETTLLFTFFTSGILGAFTTFSTFAFDIVQLIQRKEIVKMLYYTGCNLIGGICAFSLGFLV